MDTLFRTDAPNPLYDAAQYGLTQALSARYEGEPDWLGIAPESAGSISVRHFAVRRNGMDTELELTAQRKPDFTRDDSMEGSAFLDLLSRGLPRLGRRGYIEQHHLSVRPGDWHERYHVMLKGPAAEAFLAHMREVLVGDASSLDNALAAA